MFRAVSLVMQLSMVSCWMHTTTAAPHMVWHDPVLWYFLAAWSGSLHISIIADFWLSALPCTLLHACAYLVCSWKHCNFATAGTTRCMVSFWKPDPALLLALHCVVVALLQPPALLRCSFLRHATLGWTQTSLCWRPSLHHLPASAAAAPSAAAQALAQWRA
jgi:hypothetical protein